jgi:hypothetical protein
LGFFRMPKTYDNFFQWVGIAITQWAHIEDQLFMICHKCLRTRLDLASIVYYRTPTLDARLKLADELLGANLPERQPKNGGHDHPDLIQWIAIRKNLEGLLTTRRRIAHHPMRAELDYETTDGYLVHIETSFAEELRGKGAKLSPLKQEDLVEHVMKLQDALGALARFHDATLPKHI